MFVPSFDRPLHICNRRERNGSVSSFPEPRGSRRSENEFQNCHEEWKSSEKLRWSNDVYLKSITNPFDDQCSDGWRSSQKLIDHIEEAFLNSSHRGPHILFLNGNILHRHICHAGIQRKRRESSADYSVANDRSNPHLIRSDRSGEQRTFRRNPSLAHGHSRGMSTRILLRIATDSALRPLVLLPSCSSDWEEEASLVDFATEPKQAARSA